MQPSISCNGRGKTVLCSTLRNPQRPDYSAPFKMKEGRKIHFLKFPSKKAMPGFCQGKIQVFLSSSNTVRWPEKLAWNLLTNPVHFYLHYTEYMFVIELRFLWGKILNSKSGHSGLNITEISSKNQQFQLGLTSVFSRLIHHHIFLSILSFRPRDKYENPEKELE